MSEEIVTPEPETDAARAALNQLVMAVHREHLAGNFEDAHILANIARQLHALRVMKHGQPS